MIDNDMTNILKNFDGADSGAGTVTDAKTGEQKVSTAAAEKNAMKSLLEGLDAQQKSVNQMPGTHTMAKATAKHPAEKFLVGGEQDDDGYEIDTDGWNAHDEYPGPQPEEDIIDLAQYKDNYNKGYYPDSTGIEPGVKVHIGHFTPGGAGVEGTVIEVKDDIVVIKNDEGHTYKGQLKNTTVNEEVTEDAVEPGSDTWNAAHERGRKDALAGRPQKGPSDMWSPSHAAYVQGYGSAKEVQDANEDTIASRTQVSDVHEKQSLSDIFRSMDETEEDKAAQFKKELHDEIKASQLSKGANGKFNLAEDEELTWGDELLEDLKLLLDEAQRPQDVVDGVRSLIQQYEV